MSAKPGVCTQARLAWLKSMAQDEIWIALYAPGADINPRTATYTPEGEVEGLGYEAYGKRLEGMAFGNTNRCAWMDFENPRWGVATIKVESALIYNRSRNDLALCVLVFNEVIASTNGPWWLEFPPPGDTAVIRLS